MYTFLPWRSILEPHSSCTCFTDAFVRHRATVVVGCTAVLPWSTMTADTHHTPCWCCTVEISDDAAWRECAPDEWQSSWECALHARWSTSVEMCPLVFVFHLDQPRLQFQPNLLIQVISGAKMKTEFPPCDVEAWVQSRVHFFFFFPGFFSLTFSTGVFLVRYGLTHTYLGDVEQAFFATWF